MTAETEMSLEDDEKLKQKVMIGRRAAECSRRWKLQQEKIDGR